MCGNSSDEFVDHLLKMGLEVEDLKRVADDPLMASRLVRFWRKKPAGSQVFSSALEAERIMGRYHPGHFLGPKQIKKQLGLDLSSQEEDHFSLVPWSEEELDALKSTHILVAVYAPRFLVDYKTFCSLACNATSPDQKRDLLGFGYSSVVPEWHLVRRTAIPGSVNKNKASQISELVEKYNDRVPSVRTIVYTATLYNLVTGGENLFKYVAVRVRDADDNGFDEKWNSVISMDYVGVKVGQALASMGYPDIGLASEK